MIMILWWVEYITSSLTLIILYSNSNFEVPPFHHSPVGAEFHSFATKIFGVAELQFAAHSTGE